MRALAPAAIAGTLAAAVAVGVAELVAAAVRPESAPLVAVGAAVIDATPGPVREFAVRGFGTADKAVLLSGILVLLALFAAGIGVLAVDRPRWGLVGVGGFGLVGVAAVASRPAFRLVDLLPSVVGTVAGGLMLLRLRRPLAVAVSSGAEPSDPVEVTEPAAIDRRGFLVVGGTAAVVAGASGALGRIWQGVRTVAARSREAVRLPRPTSPAPPLPARADLGVPGAGPFLTPNASFYRVDTALVVPERAAERWTLTVHGMVDRSLTLTYQDLLGLPIVERVVTLTCISNEVGGEYLGTARWLGPLLRDVLAGAGVDPAADQIVCRSSDGMTIGTPARIALDGRDAMLAIGMNGEPLPVEHGFPVRMVVPGLYGYCSACKWLVDMELTTFGAYDAYWVSRGWARFGPVLTQSRVDTPAASSRLAPGRVPVAGVAWAQHRGIAGVEVRVDGGPWQPATLADQASLDAWRQWVFWWEASPGRHTLAVRATDGAGALQPERRSAPFPSGATGWHTVTVTVG
ncbi:MAG: molybdopterin-dependent oxidoreductase [Actinobacteria bacterium]|nr:molybdopterin-dependent oxidoreductase [Actinomycetota bacterium]